jgi:hypothetical protein
MLIPGGAGGFRVGGGPLPHIRGRRGLFSLPSRLAVIAGVILLPACHWLTERPGQRAYR